MDRTQKHLTYVTEISQEGLFILDPELIVTETVGTSLGMPDLVDSSGECQAKMRQFAFPSCSSSPIQRKKEEGGTEESSDTCLSSILDVIPPG
ncbi:hypothetical protein COCON_G00212180 [Conger conger]|uniref:Uncharacterized protein n=1 Tax=Conger conger TaxID=82655 RepID=A0A9Q1CXB4_CONCO|nr:hypothetical protein COCON_G00212180 [Conger conger]